MSTPNRAALLKKTFRVLKKHYKAVAPMGTRSTLEHLLYACCLENSQAETAEEAFAKLQESYFDWNEIRVTGVAELAEVLAALNDPTDAATRIKQVLQVVFETYYAFDIDHLKKQNLGKAVKEIEKYAGTTRFSVDFVSQNSLGGHAIATNEGTIKTLVILGIVTEAEATKRRLPGMERAIPKSKGIEFTSLLHQLGTDYGMTPFSNRVRGILLDIDPSAKSRFPKRKSRKKAAPPAKEKPTKQEKKAATKKAATKKAATKKAATKKAATKKAATKKTSTKKTSTKKTSTKKTSTKKAATKKAATKKAATKKAATKKAATKKASAKKQASKKTTSRKVVKKTTPRKKTSSGKKATTSKSRATKKAKGKKPTSGKPKKAATKRAKKGKRS